CCGMIGLPNVGKTTVFNALVGTGAVVANYPFSTVETNVGIAPMPDPRLNKLVDIFRSKKMTPSTLEVRDIAGLVEGASKGEWLGNQPFTAEERAILTECQLLSAKPILFIANAAEGAGEDDPLVQPVKELADKRKARLVILYGQLEAELSTLPAEDRAEFMKDAG